MDLEMCPNLDYQDLVNTVNTCVAELTSRQQYVLVEKYKGNLTNAQIGRTIHKCEEYVRQVYEKALKRLRHPSRARRLAEFLYPPMSHDSSLVL